MPFTDEQYFYPGIDLFSKTRDDKFLMSKAFAFLSFGLNAGLMLGIALLLSKNLSYAEYYRYSFAVATAQTLGVFVFEWVRMAAVRHYPGPDPDRAPSLRGAFLGGQYVLGLCAIAVALVAALVTADSYWLLIAVYAVASGAVDLQFIMLRFDAQLLLFSKLQTFRAFTSLILISSTALYFRQGSAALLGAIFANALTIVALGTVRPGFVFVRPRLSQIALLRHVASYGISAAAAGGLYQIGPFFLRCAAFRGASDISYAAFSLVMDLLQRPYNLLLDASTGVFFPDAVREHDQSPDSANHSLRFIYALHAWCLLMTFGCAMAFRAEAMSLLVKPTLVPYVLDVFPLLAAFFLVHTAISYTCTLRLHLARSGLGMLIQAAIEIISIVSLTGISLAFVGLDVFSAASGGLLGTVFGFLLATGGWRTTSNQLPWKSWLVAFLTTVPLLLIGQIRFSEHFLGICGKAMIATPIIAIGGFVGFLLPFGLQKRIHFGHWRVASTTELK